MLEQQLEKQAGGGMDQSSESPRRAEDGLQAVTMPGPLITGFDQNLQPDMNIFSDSWTAPLTGLPQLLPSWPSTTKLVDPNPAGVSTEKFGFDSELTSPGGTAPMNMVLDEDIGLGNVTPMSPADSEISHLMLSDLCVHLPFLLVYPS